MSDWRRDLSLKLEDFIDELSSMAPSSPKSTRPSRPKSKPSGLPTKRILIRPTTPAM